MATLILGKVPLILDNQLVEAHDQELHKYALPHQISGIVGRLGIEVILLFSTYLLLQSRSFLMPSAKNIFGCAQILIHTES
jgi:hypothetical protein